MQQGVARPPAMEAQVVDGPTKLERLPAHWVIGARKQPLARQQAPGAAHAAAEQAVPLPRNELGAVQEVCEERMQEPFCAQQAPDVPVGVQAAQAETSWPPS